MFSDSIRWPVRPAFIFVFTSLFITVSGQSRPPQVFQFSDLDGQVSWSRLQNRELRVDFSLENPQLPSEATLREKDFDLVDSASGVGGLWVDVVNGERIQGGTAAYVFPEPGYPDAILNLTTTTGDGLTLMRSIRIAPEGANLEVDYRLINTHAKTIPYRYGIETEWRPGPEGAPIWIHLPRTTEITRFQPEAQKEEFNLAGKDLDEAWYCVDSPATGLAMFLVADKPFEGWTASPPAQGKRRISTSLSVGELKPGEWIEGTYWISIVSEIGIPISAGPKYIAGLVWSENDFGGYCLESRLIGMPKSLKKLRIFSAVGSPGSLAKAVPKYRRRSRLSNTEVVSVPLPAFSYRGGVVEIEQSLYSSSENMGYWKVLLQTPEAMMTASVSGNTYGVHHLPGVEYRNRPEAIPPAPPREPITPEQVGRQLERIEQQLRREKLEEISDSIEGGSPPQETTLDEPSLDIWEAPGFVLDLTGQHLTDDEESALLAIESGWDG